MSRKLSFGPLFEIALRCGRYHPRSESMCGVLVNRSVARFRWANGPQHNVGTGLDVSFVNTLAYTAGCETGSAIDAFAVNSGFVSVDGMTYLIQFES
jgi:hypothetical protein